MEVFSIDQFGHPIYAVIPVDNMKRPLIQWKEYQTRLPSPEEKERWIKQLNGRIAGWAMPTGQVSGLIALDFDSEKGLETLEKLGLRPNVKTPGNGVHVWIEAPDYPVRTGVVDPRWPNMELRGDGGYVVVVGENIKSAHKGAELLVGNYVILDSIPSTEGDLGRELAEFVFQAKEGDVDFAIARVVAEAVEKAGEGRNNAGFWLACQLRDMGQNKDESWNILSDVFYPATPRGSHAYTKQELKDSLNSAFSKAPNKASASVAALEIFNKQENVELWHTADGDRESYITVGGENFPVGSMRTREYINALYFRAFKKPINKTALEEVIDTLKWTANFDGKGYDIHLRVGHKEGKVYLENTGDSSLKFLKTLTMGDMPKPKHGKSLDVLRRYLNIYDEDWPLIKGLVLTHFMPDGPYPVGVFLGPQGSAKSTNQSIILNIADPRPNIAMGRYRLPRNENDLVIMAKRNRVLGFDNVSTIPEWLSDSICILSTGGNLLRRRLYTDDDMIAYGQKKPVLLNGIGDIVTRPDLLDRSIVIECPYLQGYKTEHQLYAEYREDLPYILGAVLDLSQKAMDNFETVRDVDDSVRMSDALRWVTAAGIEEFEPRFIHNRNRGAEIAVQNSAVGRYIKAVADKHRGEPTNPDLLERLNVPEGLAFGKWVGTMHRLYEEGELTATGDYDWPKKFENFVSQVYRVEPMLSRLGISLQKHRTNFMEMLFIGYTNEQNT